MPSETMKQKFPLPLLIIFLFLSAGIAIAGYFYYEQQANLLRADAENNLETIIDLKVQLIIQWRKERFGDALVLSSNPLIARAVRMITEGKNRDESKEAIFSVMRSVQKLYSYKSISLLDAKGNPVLSFPNQSEEIGLYTERLAAEAVSKKKVFFSDLYRSESVTDIHLDLLAPVVASQGIANVYGIFYLCIDSRQFLFPLMQSWPTHSRTAETLLVRKDGNDVVFLNPLRHRKNTALNFRIPLSGASLPAAMAIKGQTGIVEGNDYRNIPVLAAIRAVPDTPWFIVAKIDRSEVFAVLRKRAGFIVISVVMLILASGLGVLLIWRQNYAEHYRKQYETEHERQLYAQRYELLTKHANDIILLVKKDGKIIDANERAISTYGYTKDELLQLNLRDLGASDAQELLNEQLKEVEEHGGMIFEVTHQRKDGTIFPVEVSARSIDLEGEKFYQNIIRDITERKRAEKLIKEREALLNEVGDIAKIGGWKMDMETSKATWSKGTYDIVEIDYKKPVPGLHEHVGYYLPEYREMIANKMKALIETKQSIMFEAKLKTAKGNIKWCQAFGEAVVKDGKLTELRGTFQDITDRIQAEEALKASEEKYRLVVENAAEAILILQDGKIKFSNHQSIALSGYSAEEITSVPFSNFLHTDDKDMVMDIHRKRLLGENIPSTYSFRFINKSGTTIWVQITGVLITWEGRPAALVFLKDITILKELEEQLLQSKKMEAIGLLAGGIAHNFNNLLMTILGYTSLMLMKTEKTDPFYEQLKIIEKEVEHGAELTRQLLGFARGGKYEVKPVNVNDVIIKTSDTFGKTKKEITIHKKLQEDLHTIEVDRGQIEQVLLNLYLNAWQAMPSGGSLYLETQNAMLDEHQYHDYASEPGPYVKITMTDTGVGMDAETQKRIFEPFFTTKGVGQGTGLGLASAYGIIKNHGGIIDVYSEKGHGTTFTIYLPASGKEVVETKPAEGSLITGHETILIVDDEKEVLLAIKALLEELGYKILTARSGLNAIEMYKKHSKDIKLVILDMIMPEMDGQETAVKLMEIDKNVRVLLSSGYSIDVEDKTILDLGCKGFIQKPFRIEELSQKIRNVLSSGDS